MSGKKINVKNLIEKIENVTRERISKDGVVPLDAFRTIKKKDEIATILLVDDDDTVRAGLKKALETDGHRVLSVADSAELVRVLDDNPLHLIILDVGLPWINGFELAEMMKENEDLKRIPIVFISAHKTERDIKKGFQVGAADYIKKPFDLNQVRKTIQTLLQLNKNTEKK